jgi:cellobiose phosphorylase
MHTEIVVSAEDDIEIRRLHVTNRSATSRTIEITSYAEVVIAPPASDAMQPAFSNLFVQTEILERQQTIICSRRPSAATEQPPCMFHSVGITSARAEFSYETDRMKFIGHGNTTANPRAMGHSGRLSGSQGSVLDPIVSIRCKIVLEPEEMITIDLIIGISDTRQICESLIEKYQDKHHKDRVFELAWTHSQVILRQLNATGSDGQLFNRLAGSVIFINPALRASPSIIIKNQSLISINFY